MGMQARAPRLVWTPHDDREWTGLRSPSALTSDGATSMFWAITSQVGGRGLVVYLTGMNGTEVMYAQGKAIGVYPDEAKAKAAARRYENRYYLSAQDPLR